MNDITEYVEFKMTRIFSLGQWTRSSGRVVRRKTEQMLHNDPKNQTLPTNTDLAEIYRKFLKLQDEDSRDLIEAVSYGLKLLDESSKNTSFRGEAHNRILTKQEVNQIER